MNDNQKSIMTKKVCSKKNEIGKRMKKYGYKIKLKK